MYDPQTMTAQEVYDASAHHLLEQGERSMSKSSCAYRGPKGLKCAAGIFITDEQIEANDINEDMSWRGTLDYIPELRSEHDDLIMHLQGIHDNQDVTEWMTYLDILAHDNDLTPISETLGAES